MAMGPRNKEHHPVVSGCIMCPPYPCGNHNHRTPEAGLACRHVMAETLTGSHKSENDGPLTQCATVITKRGDLYTEMGITGKDHVKMNSGTVVLLP